MKVIKHIGETGENPYTFDHIFQPGATQKEVYIKAAQPITNAVLEGYNGTIFAYGQTSSGKTHTMLGSSSKFGFAKEPGVLALAAEQVFKHISACNERNYVLRISFVEIYNEIIRDLLADGADPVVSIREDPRRGVYCEALELQVDTCADVLAAMKKGVSKRSVEATAMNETSSRSHTIFKMVMESTLKPCGGEEVDGAVLVSSLN